jgi:hypothetical protein
MLAGNVGVRVDGGTLFITGDGASNGVSVHQLDNGRYAVTGFAVAGVDTRINGAFTTRIVNGVTNDIVVDLNAGHDVFVMGQNAAARQALANEVSGGAAGVVPAGPAANPATTAQSQTRVPLNLFIRTDEGVDGVGISARIGSDDITGEHSGGIGQILTGVAVDRVAVERTTAFDDLLIETGDGNDTVRGFRVRTWDFFFASLGNGHDSIAVTDYHGFHSHLIGGNGNDDISTRDFHTDLETFLFGEAGRDRIAARGTTALELQIITHGGADAVQVNNSHFGDLHIDTGSESDNVNLSVVTVVDELSIFLGSGNDRLSGDNSSADDTLLDGGSNFDTLVDNGNNNFRSATIVNFERRI